MSYYQLQQIYSICVFLHGIVKAFLFFCFQIDMKLIKTNNWILLPEPNEECVDKQCYNIYANHNITLYPDQVNQINPGFLIELPEYQVLHIKSHICNKPWRILGEFIYPTKEKTIILPVITDTKCQINIGDVLCHIQPIYVSHALLKMKGTFIIKIN